jgi:hypothetical protein
MLAREDRARRDEELGRIQLHEVLSELKPELLALLEIEDDQLGPERT